MPRSRRGWGRTARLGLAVLACAFAGAGQAQSLDDAVDRLADYLKLQGDLTGKEVLVRPDYFFELGSERNLLLSEYLASQFTTALARHGVRPVPRSGDEDTAITLQGRWRFESGDLVLSVEAKQSVGDRLNTGRVHASRQERVPVANIDRRYLEPDIESHGRYVARQLGKGIEANTSGHGRYRLHVRPFSAPDVAEPDRFNRYLLGKWRPAFTGSRRFSLVRRDGSDGELHGEVYVAGERIDIHLHILDGQGQEVAATTVEMDRGLFPPGLFGPDVTAELAKCAGLVDASRPEDAKACYEGVRAGAPGDARVGEEVRAGLERIAGLEAAVEESYWKKCEENDDARYCEDYLSRYEDGVYARLAKQRLADLEVDVPPPETKFRDCPECPELVVVPSGSFMMGSPSSEEGRVSDEGPVHRVRIGRPFAVGVYEVTFGEWDACVSDRGCGGYRPSDEGWGRGRRPVINVNWKDAQAYVRWLSRKTGKEYRLLSESEWEYVARAGTETARYWGESERGQCRYANGADRTVKRRHSRRTTVDCDDGYYQTAPVGEYEANDFGLHDVLGNVSEWVEDCENPSGSYRGVPSDGSAWESGECDWRVMRGGSWEGRPSTLRSAHRQGGNSTGDRYNDAGFRVARTLAP